MLIITSLNKTFKTPAGDVTAVRDVSFSTTPGEMVAIVGASGSGKSTLLSLLGLLESPDNGSIKVDDVELAGLDAKGRTAYRARKVGFVFQQFNLIPNLSALENVMLPLEFAGWSVSERKTRAREVLSTVGLGDDKVLRRPAKLSGGEQQRVAIARALVTNPGLILADEPTGNLDRKTGERIIALLRDAAEQEKRTVVVVTHDEKIATAADRRLEIEDGVLREIA